MSRHLALWTNESSTLHLVQVSYDFDTVFLAFINICNGFCFICVAVEKVKVFLYVSFLLPPIEFLQWSTDLVLDPREKNRCHL